MFDQELAMRRAMVQLSPRDWDELARAFSGSPWEGGRPVCRAFRARLEKSQLVYRSSGRLRPYALTMFREAQSQAVKLLGAMIR